MENINLEKWKIKRQLTKYNGDACGSMTVKACLSFYIECHLNFAFVEKSLNKKKCLGDVERRIEQQTV
jgi:hypothetical protein